MFDDEYKNVRILCLLYYTYSLIINCTYNYDTYVGYFGSIMIVSKSLSFYIMCENKELFSFVIYIFTYFIYLCIGLSGFLYVLVHLILIIIKLSNIDNLFYKLIWEFCNNIVYLYITYSYFKNIIYKYFPEGFIENIHKVFWSCSIFKNSIKCICKCLLNYTTQICINCSQLIIKYCIKFNYKCLIFKHKIKSLCSDKQSTITHDNICVICCEEMTNLEHISNLECKHKFHLECIMKWKKIKDECPSCRATPIKIVINL